MFGKLSERRRQTGDLIGFVIPPDDLALLGYGEEITTVVFRKRCPRAVGEEVNSDLALQLANGPELLAVCGGGEDHVSNLAYVNLHILVPDLMAVLCSTADRKLLKKRRRAPSHISRAAPPGSLSAHVNNHISKGGTPWQKHTSVWTYIKK